MVNLASISPYVSAEVVYSSIYLPLARYIHEAKLYGNFMGMATK